jgi:predicted metal-dependent hydrolase
MGVIQVRGVSDEAHRRLKEMAAAEGLSLSEYLRQELEELAATLTWDEWAAGVRSRGHLAPGQAAELIREVREEREQQLYERMPWRDDRR